MNDIPKLHLNAEERALRAELPRAVRPKLASTIVLTAGSRSDPKILMGQRARRHDFMPSVFVFPGGRVDRADSYAPYVGDLTPRTERILEAAYSPRRARALVLASIRETWEETGLMLGRRENWSKNLKHEGWDAFREAGFVPDLGDIEVFGRAVTPPHRHKRFDTWFFIKHLGEDTLDISDSVELLNVGWFSWDDIKDLKTARATDMMLAVLRQYLAQSKPPASIFYSHMVRGSYIQEQFP